ncbi:hypothetical protein K8I61_02435 [bacterium]|nr:hypothetical protein [bacterium]
MIESMAASGADVLSVDARISLTEVRRRAGKDTRVQGNLDTLVLWSGPEKIRAAVRELVRETEGHGHIVNLGHGVLPGTPVEGVGAFVKAVQELGE